MDPKISQSLQNLANAMQRLEEALAEPAVNSIIIDGTIQRFEFVIELFWKTMKRVMAAEGIEVSTPKETLQQAYQMKWINDETAWLQMLRDRNMTSHLYDEAMAQKIYADIKQHFSLLQATYEFLANR